MSRTTKCSFRLQVSDSPKYQHMLSVVDVQLGGGSRETGRFMEASVESIEGQEIDEST